MNASTSPRSCSTECSDQLSENQDAFEAALIDAATSDTVLREAKQILSKFLQLLGPAAQGKQAA